MSLFDCIDWAFVILYGAMEHSISRWLPWYRRYLSVAPLLVAAIVVHDRRDFWLTVAGVVIWQWNRFTANRNRDNNNDLKKVESAEAARLTEVQETAFGREATEAA